MILTIGAIANVGLLLGVLFALVGVVVIGDMLSEQARDTVQKPTVENLMFASILFSMALGFVALALVMTLDSPLYRFGRISFTAVLFAIAIVGTFGIPMIVLPAISVAERMGWRPQHE